MIVRRPVGIGVLVVASSMFAACASSDSDISSPTAAETSAGTASLSTEQADAETVTTVVRSETTVSAVTEEKDPVTRSPDAEGTGVQPQGLTTVTARITTADGEICDVCMWLADSAAERATGLMGVTDLGEPVGMAFSWDAPTDGRFFMLGTPTPLSIAWFAESGEHVGQTDMIPCITEDSSTCERYGADAPYTLAIEMFEGQLAAVGITPGARLELVAGTESPTCLTGPA